jgi:hypothetical protein
MTLKSVGSHSMQCVVHSVESVNLQLHEMDSYGGKKDDIWVLPWLAMTAYVIRGETS